MKFLVKGFRNTPKTQCFAFAMQITWKHTLMSSLGDLRPPFSSNKQSPSSRRLMRDFLSSCVSTPEYYSNITVFGNSLSSEDRILEQSKKTEGLNSSTLNMYVSQKENECWLLIDCPWLRSSYVEFQTMQNGARQYHLAALLELRAFLNHIRAGQRGRDPKTYPVRNHQTGGYNATCNLTAAIDLFATDK